MASTSFYGQNKTSKKKLTQTLEIQTTIKLKYNFEIKVGQKEKYENFETYSLFILMHNNKQIYIDTSMTEYEFGDKLYPIIRLIDDKTFEIFVEVNDRPNKNYLKYFKIHNNKIIEEKKLPTFISHVANLDNDDNLEYAGFWDFGETWGNNNSLTAYNPIIYYEITAKGLQIDSLLTIEKNKKIYGDFKGYKYDEKIGMPINVTNKFNAEIERIINAK